MFTFYVIKYFFKELNFEKNHKNNSTFYQSYEYLAFAFSKNKQASSKRIVNIKWLREEFSEKSFPPNLNKAVSNQSLIQTSSIFRHEGEE